MPLTANQINLSNRLTLTQLTGFAPPVQPDRNGTDMVHATITVLKRIALEDASTYVETRDRLPGQSVVDTLYSDALGKIRRVYRINAVLGDSEWATLRTEYAQALRDTIRSILFPEGLPAEALPARTPEEPY